jgi:hypothetical protein
MKMMKRLREHAKKLISDFPLLKEDIDNIMNEAEEKYEEEGLTESDIVSFLIRIDELL